jgi:hypothetical protein
VRAPILDEWFGTPGTPPGVTGYLPNPAFGYSCVLPKPQAG